MKKSTAVACIPALALGVMFASQVPVHAGCTKFTCNFAPNIAHITSTHCQGAYTKSACTIAKKSRFTDTVCQSQTPAAALATLCATMQKEAGCTQSRSGDRTVATAVLDDPVGLDAANKCNDTGTFTVVYTTATGVVVTAHPGKQ